MRKGEKLVNNMDKNSKDYKKLLKFMIDKNLLPKATKRKACMVKVFRK